MPEQESAEVEERQVVFDPVRGHHTRRLEVPRTEHQGIDDIEPRRDLLDDAVVLGDEAEIGA
ncbi:hypothetical protein [Nocardia salmonicida]|uniref:hypothetical protein n=1 Tax=Nocardia salmonicida TaxID=53431 RepID=UPI003793D765